MITGYYDLIEAAAPFAWVQYDFMKNALLAVVLISPLFALVGTMVVGKRMAFFSDVLGHSALAGVALGVLFGVKDPFWTMAGFMVALAVLVNAFKGMTQAATDTVLGVFFAVVTAFGIVVLSKGGGFNRFTTYLVGDILAITPAELVWFVLIAAGVFVYWVCSGNNLVLISVNPMLARSRGISVRFAELSFVVIVALLVAFSIRLVGVLIINSLLVLPAAAARNMSANVREYTLWSVLISLAAGVSGLILSYYWGTASGATIVLVCAGLYVVSAAAGRCVRR